MKKFHYVTIMIVLAMLFSYAMALAEPVNFRLGTGKETGVYYRVDAKNIKAQVNPAYIKIETIPEKNGTPELIAKIKRGELDGAIIQYGSEATEVLLEALKTILSLNRYSESHLLARKALEEYERRIGE